MSPLNEQLVALLRQKALKRLEEPVQLASGEWSADFIDGKEGLCEWRDLALAGMAIKETVHLAGANFTAVGGLTMGADALAVGVAAAADCKWFFVRKEPKARGTGRFIEGCQIDAEHRVLLVDDVVTSGGSILKAYEVIAGTGAAVVAAVTLVDRGEQARPRFDELGIPYFPMATYKELGIPPVGDGNRRAFTAV